MVRMMQNGTQVEPEDVKLTPEQVEAIAGIVFR